MRRRAILAACPTAFLAACASTTPGPAPIRLVFFEDDSIRLGPNATAVVAEAAAEAARAPNAAIRVAGYVAPEPGVAPVVALSRARAEAVAAELVRLGVAQSRIQVQGRGGTTFDAEAPVEARRVEIRIGS